MAKWELHRGAAWRSGWPRSDVVGLSHGERLFRLVFESSPIGMAIVGLDGRWLRVNPAMCAILGYSAEELLELDFQTITHPDDAADDVLLLRRLLAGEIDEYQFGKRYLRKDGAVAPVIVSAALVRDEVGAPEHFLTQVVDLTVVRALEQAAGEQERLFRVAFDRSPIPQVIRGADDRLHAVNTALARTLGAATVEPLLGRRLAEFLTPETVRRRREAMISAAARGAGSGAGPVEHVTYEADVIRLDGSLRHAHVTTVAIRDESVPPVRFLVTLQTADQGSETVGTPADLSPP